GAGNEPHAGRSAAVLGVAAPGGGEQPDQERSTDKPRKHPGDCAMQPHQVYGPQPVVQDGFDNDAPGDSDGTESAIRRDHRLQHEPIEPQGERRCRRIPLEVPPSLACSTRVEATNRQPTITTNSRDLMRYARPS